MATDFGPVPASQLKSESNSVFSALEQGRRVLISRYGTVVAVIDPASVPRHSDLLAAYAVPGFGATLELTATEIAQGSPSEFIHRAEEGVASLVTRKNKVYGVLMPLPDEPIESDPDEQERLLVQFEKEHPDATPAEFAAEVARLTTGDSGEAVAAGPVASLRADLSFTVDDLADVRLWSDAILIEAVAFEQTRQVGLAKARFNDLIERLADVQDAFLRRRVRVAQVELARLYVSTGDAPAALRLAEKVLGEVRPDPVTTADGDTIAAQRSDYEPA